MWNDLLDIELIEATGVDLPYDDLVLLEKLFIAAHEICVAYAPLLVAGSPVPERYKMAEILQASHIWESFKSGGDNIGADGFIRPLNRDLVYAARDLLRPKQNPLSRLR